MNRKSQRNNPGKVRRSPRHHPGSTPGSTPGTNGTPNGTPGTNPPAPTSAPTGTNPPAPIDEVGDLLAAMGRPSLQAARQGRLTLGHLEGQMDRVLAATSGTPAPAPASNAGTTTALATTPPTNGRRRDDLASPDQLQSLLVEASRHTIDTNPPDRPTGTPGTGRPYGRENLRQVREEAQEMLRRTNANAELLRRTGGPAERLRDLAQQARLRDVREVFALLNEAGEAHLLVDVEPTPDGLVRLRGDIESRIGALSRLPGDPLRAQRLERALRILDRLLRLDGVEATLSEALAIGAQQVGRTLAPPAAGADSLSDEEDVDFDEILRQSQANRAVTAGWAAAARAARPGRHQDQLAQQVGRTLAPPAAGAGADSLPDEEDVDFDEILRQSQANRAVTAGWAAAARAARSGRHQDQLAQQVGRTLAPPAAGAGAGTASAATDQALFDRMAEELDEETAATDRATNRRLATLEDRVGDLAQGQEELRERVDALELQGQQSPPKAKKGKGKRGGKK